MPCRIRDDRVVEKPFEISAVEGRATVAVGYCGDDAETVLLEHRDVMRDFFAGWAGFGADVLLAPTRRATPYGLRPLGLAQYCREVNLRAVEVLRDVAATAPQSPAIAAQLGPFHSHAEDPGRLPFDRIYAQYHEQVKPLATVGLDLVVLRGIDNTRVLRAALAALRELWEGAVVAVIRSEGFAGSADVASRSHRDGLVETLHHFDVVGLGFPDGGETEPRRLPFAFVGEAGFRATVLELESAVTGAATEDPDVGSASLPESGGDMIRRGLGVGVDFLVVDVRPGPISTLETGICPAPTSFTTPLGESSASTPAPETTSADHGPGQVLAVVPLTALIVDGPGAVAGVLDGLPEASHGRFVGVHVDSGQSAGLEPQALERLLRSLEDDSGLPVGIRSADPGDLEACAKAAMHPPVLVFGGEYPLDHECVLYLTDRYGVRSVLPLEPRPAANLATVAAETCAALGRSACESRVPWESIYLDVSALADSPVRSLGDPSGDQDAGLAGVIEEIRQEFGVRFACTVRIDRDEPIPGKISTSLAAFDLVILEFSAWRDQG